MIVGIGDMETIMRRQSALTVTRSTRAALTRMATCTGMETSLFQKETVTAAHAAMGKLHSAHGWVARAKAEAEDDFIYVGLIISLLKQAYIILHVYV